MSNINISNSTVYININEDAINKAKDDLLRKLYYARNKPTMGGYKAWHELLSMYYSGDYESMKEFIKSCTGKGAKTRKECIEYLNTIICGRN